MRRLLLLAALLALLPGCAAPQPKVAPLKDEGIRDTSVGRWENPFRHSANLAGVITQQFPDGGDFKPYEGKHPCMILFVFWDGRIRQINYEPDGSSHDAQWWHLGPENQFYWDQVDFTHGSDPLFRNHPDPRTKKTPAPPTR